MYMCTYEGDEREDMSSYMCRCVLMYVKVGVWTYICMNVSVYVCDCVCVCGQ